MAEPLETLPVLLHPRTPLDEWMKLLEQSEGSKNGSQSDHTPNTITKYDDVEVPLDESTN